MLTEKQAADAPAPRAAGVPLDPASLVCLFEGHYVPLAAANVNIMTHAFMYGTAVFEGIRAYWNEEQQQLFALKVPEHMTRIRNSCKVMLMTDVPSVDQLTNEAIEVLQRNRFREDAYVRPSFYKSSRAIGVKLHGLEHRLLHPRGPVRRLRGHDRRRQGRHGLLGAARATRRSRRGQDRRLVREPGISKTEANLNGFDEALVLSDDGHVSEGSAENIFVVRDGVLHTPTVADDILEGITRAGIMEIAADLGYAVVERTIDRSELYIADEAFFTGTGAQISPIVEVDRRPLGTGVVGPITARIKDRYFDIVRGRVPEFGHWVTPVYPR